MHFIFDQERLYRLLTEFGPEAYAQAKPFPHAIFDDFLPDSVLRCVIENFSEVRQERWKRFENSNEKKLASQSLSDIPPFCRTHLNEFNSGVFIEFLEQLTGINGLIADPHLVGGGMHFIQPGGMLGVHADFNWHSRLKLDRRLNVILYLNTDWDESYGGHLELWDREKSKPIKKILPIFNRLVVFSTTSTSFHGHPQPLACPQDRARMSLALYYYSNGRPVHEKESSHSTLFLKDSSVARWRGIAKSRFNKIKKAILRGD